MKLFVIIVRYVRPLHEIDRHIENHRAWLRDRYREERLIASGPMQPRTGGVIIARAKNADEVWAMLSSDPFQSAGVAEYEAIEFDPSMHDPRFAWAVDARSGVEPEARSGHSVSEIGDGVMH